jgi:integral membrane protein
MVDLLKTSLGRLRIITFAEGLSYLVLLFVAMPLKYLAGYPSAVRSFGMIHGVLFIIFMLYVVICFLKYKWSISMAAIIFAASLIPFANFYIDKHYLHPDYDRLNSQNDSADQVTVA